jgi:hypothetical protein
METQKSSAMQSPDINASFTPLNDFGFTDSHIGRLLGVSEVISQDTEKNRYIPTFQRVDIALPN